MWSILLMRVVGIAYQIGAWGTFGYLTFFDGYAYTWWNWLIAVPVNIFMGQI